MHQCFECRSVSISNLISLWSLELKSELKSSDKHNGSNPMLPLRGLGRQLPYHSTFHANWECFPLKKSLFIKLCASIGNTYRTLLLEKTQKASKGLFVFIQLIRKKKHHYHSWHRSNQYVCPSQLRVQSYTQLTAFAQ